MIQKTVSNSVGRLYVFNNQVITYHYNDFTKFKKNQLLERNEKHNCKTTTFCSVYFEIILKYFIIAFLWLVFI